MAWAFVWPIAWIGYTFLRGALVDWYPYPFLNVTDVGYGAAIRNTLIVVVVAVILVAIFKALDRIRTVGAPRQRPHPPATKARAG